MTATDNFTVVFTWNLSNPEFIFETMMSSGIDENCIENPDAVTQYGNLNNWHNAIGTGPFILTDFVDGSSATLVKNPNYWGYDERYPQNKLPYIDQLNVLIITNAPTALAAFRAGKIAALDRNSLDTSQGMTKTNPEVVQVPLSGTLNLDLEPRNDMAPTTTSR